MDEFFRSLQEIAAFRDFCTACVDERLRDRLVEEARRRLLETANLTLQTAADICRAAENAANSRSAIGGQISTLQKMSEYRRRRDGSRSSRASYAARPEGAAARTSHTDSRACDVELQLGEVRHMVKLAVVKQATPLVA